jgi:ferrochelatase
VLLDCIKKEDSPLRLYTARQTTLLADKTRALLADKAPTVQHAMSYGEPALKTVLAEQVKTGAERVVVLPLYPQFSATTTGSVYDQLAAFIKKTRNLPTINIIKDYHDHPEYIAALATSVRDFWQANGRANKLLMSFHGIPVANIDKGDPYYDQCKRTAELLASALELSEQDWAISFQSRLGRAQWLQPYTSEILQEWGEKVVQGVDVICPAFSSDCLETLEEIAIQNREIFEDAGGSNYRYIPCLNDRDDHISLLVSLVKRYL